MASVSGERDDWQSYPQHSDGLKLRKLDAYYRVLSEHEPFQQDMQRLAWKYRSLIGEIGARPRLLLTDPAEFARQAFQAPHFDDPVDQHIWTHARDVPDGMRRDLED